MKIDVALEARGRVGSGKTIVLNMIKEMLEAKGWQVEYGRDHELFICNELKTKHQSGQLNIEWEKRSENRENGKDENEKA